MSPKAKQSNMAYVKLMLAHYESNNFLLPAYPLSQVVQKYLTIHPCLWIYKLQNSTTTTKSLKQPREETRADVVFTESSWSQLTHFAVIKQKQGLVKQFTNDVCLLIQDFPSLCKLKVVSTKQTFLCNVFWFNGVLRIA